MKKILYSIFAFAAVAGLSSCKQDAVDDSNLAGDENTLTIIGTRTVKVALVTDADDTRASLDKDEATGRYTFNWENGDKLGGYEMVYAYYKYTSYTDPSVTIENVTVDENGNAFAEIKYQEIEGANQYDFALFYPQSAVAGQTMNYNGGTGSTLPITVPEVQYPTVNAPDPKATVLCAYVQGEYGDENPLETAEINFKHLTAYGKMTLKNLDPAKTVKSVKFDFLTTDFCVAGRFDSYKFVDEYNGHNACQGKSFGNTNCSCVTLDYSSSPLSVNEDGTATVWFGLVSNSALANTGVNTFKVEVTYDDELKPVSKTFTSDSKTLTFQNSKITSFSVDMTPPAVAGTYIYVPVQSVTPGTDYIIGMEYNGTTYILSSTTNGGQYSGIAGNSKVNVTPINIAGFTKVGNQLEYEVVTDAPTEYIYCTLSAGDDYFNFYSKKKGQDCILWGNTGSGALLLYDGGNKTNEVGKFKVSTNGNVTAMTFYQWSRDNYVYTDGTTATVGSSAANVTIYAYDPDGQPAAPVQEVQLKVTSATANQQHNASPASNLIDGKHAVNNDNDIYHSPWGSGGDAPTSFPVILTFDLSSTSDVYRMHYYTRNDSQNGAPGRFDVEYQTANDNTWYPAIYGKSGENNPMFDFGETLGSNRKEFPNENYTPTKNNGVGLYHEADFSASPLKGATKVRLTFYTTQSTWITGGEVEFFGTSDSGGSVPENPDVKLTIQSGEAENGEYASVSPITKLFDGTTVVPSGVSSADSYIYHSRWSGATVFPVKLRFTFNKASDVSYFYYYTRQESDANGLPGKFDVQYRCQGENNYKNLNSNYSESINNAQFDMEKKPGNPYHKITFPETVENVTDIRLVFYEGSCNDNQNGYISGVEIEFYGKPAN